MQTHSTGSDHQEFLQSVREQFGPHEQGLRALIARRRVGNPSEVEEILQEVYLRLLSRHEPTPIQNWQTYLRTTASSIINARHNDRKRENTCNFLDLEGEEDEHPGIGSEADIDSTIARIDVQRALRAIPPECSEAFMRSWFCKQTYQEIGDATQSSATALMTPAAASSWSPEKPRLL